MADISTKPYLIRAIHAWCEDSGFRPYIAVMVDEHTFVPREFVRNGEIVLNVSAQATNHLRIGNELIEFEARFSGAVRQVSVPIGNVSAIYAQETGHGMAFDVPKPLALAPEPPGAAPRGPQPAAQALKPERPKLVPGGSAREAGASGGAPRERSTSEKSPGDSPLRAVPASTAPSDTSAQPQLQRPGPVIDPAALSASSDPIPAESPRETSAAGKTRKPAAKSRRRAPLAAVDAAERSEPSQGPGEGVSETPAPPDEPPPAPKAGRAHLKRVK